jgi:taurine-pyruvate aminotransferase
MIRMFSSAAAGPAVQPGYAAIACTVTTEAVFALFKDDAADPMSYFRDISTFMVTKSGCTP